MLCLAPAFSLSSVRTHQRTALHLASRKCHSDAVALLVRLKAFPDLRDRFGHTALELARARHTDTDGRAQTLSVLMEPAEC